MLHLLALSTVIADGITIKLGNNVWTIGLGFIIYLIIALVVGLIAEAIVGWRVPFGFVGARGYQSDSDSGLQLLGHRYYLRHEVAQVIVTSARSVTGCPITRTLRG